MQFVYLLVTLSHTLLQVRAYPHSSSTGNVDTWSYGDANRGGMVLSHSYDPYYNKRAIRSGLTTYSLRQPDTELMHQARENQAILRRRQALLEVNDTPPQQNEIYYPQEPEYFVTPVEETKLVKPDENTDIVPTTKSSPIPESVEPKAEEPAEPVPATKKSIATKTNVKRPLHDDDEDEDKEEYDSKLPTALFFPMYFGRGGESGSSGPIAIANSFSSGRGGASTSHAIAVGTPDIEH